jgi:hypothetical protein
MQLVQIYSYRNSVFHLKSFKESGVCLRLQVESTGLGQQRASDVWRRRLALFSEPN